MESHQKKTFVAVIKAILLLALGALWAQALAFLVTLPDGISIALIVIIILVCILVLVVSNDDDDSSLIPPKSV